MVKTKHKAVNADGHNGPEVRETQLAAKNDQEPAAERQRKVPSKESPPGKPLVLPDDPNPPAERIPEPTTTELALIAALLRREPHKWPDLASDALDLWEACAKEVWNRRERRRSRFGELCAQLPQPKKHPTPLKEFLELMVPKKRQDNRELAYRLFLKDWKQLDMQKTGDLLAQHKMEPADAYDFKLRAFLFRIWLDVSLHQSRSLSGLKGARKLTDEEIAVKEKAASEERRKAVAAADARFHKLYFEMLGPMIV